MNPWLVILAAVLTYALVITIGYIVSMVQEMREERDK